MVGGLDSSSCSTVELKGISISLWFCIANILCNGLFYKLVQICSLIITSFSHHSQLSVSVCRIWLHLNLSYFCLSEHPACPSIPPWLFWQFHQPLLSVCLSVLPWLCWQLLGLMPSQCSAPSWPMERRLHSLSRWTGNHSFSHFFFLKSLFYPFPHLLRHSVSLFLSSVSISIFLHSWPSCCWETDRKQDWEENR